MGFSLKRMFKPPKWLKKMKPLKVLGKVAQFAAPLIPGIGLPAAALIGAGGGLLSGGGVGGAIQGGLIGGAGNALLGGAGYKGITGLLGRAGGALKSAALPAAQQVMGGGGAPSYEGSADPYGVGDASAAANAAIAGTPIGGATQATAPTGGRGLIGGIGNLLGRAGKGVIDWAAQNPMTALGAGSAILGSIGAAKTGNEAEQAMRAATYDPENPYHNPNARRRGAVQTANAALGGY